jgi:hypothetical protein
MPFLARYRHRLQLERDLSIGHCVYTPYLNAEVFYDTRYNEWARDRYSTDAQVPAGGRVLLQPYYLRQNQSRASTAHVNTLGLELDSYFRRVLVPDQLSQHWHFSHGHSMPVRRGQHTLDFFGIERFN